MTITELAAKWDAEIAERERRSSWSYQMEVLDGAGYEFFPGGIVKDPSGHQCGEKMPDTPLWQQIQIVYAHRQLREPVEPDTAKPKAKAK